MNLPTIDRRSFLSAAAASAAALAGPRFAWAEAIPADVRIARIIGFDLPSRRNKVAGKNSRLDVHGDAANDRMVRVVTTDGIEGLGNSRADQKELAALLGRPLADCFDPAAPRAVCLGRATMPLWDLAGKALGKPVYELIGAHGPQRVKAYDGSIYFADLLPQYESQPLDRFKEEVDLGLALGHRAFKIKIGRGAKWMARAEGDRRDLEVVRTIRQHAGTDVLLGVDANNGYDLPGTKRLLDELADARLAFVEEMFPEEVDQCLELKSFIRDRGWKTLLADGETQDRPEALKPFVDRQAIDVLQGDMNHFGFEGVLQEAAWGRPRGVQVAPHNWGSLIGFYMQLHIGRGIDNFYLAEHDPLTSDVVVAEGYQLADGQCTVPAAPGFGLAISEDNFATQAKVRFDLRS
jgi:L-alanine-DL-glutamate epimerase-like enolase superfamily enzyme